MCKHEPDGESKRSASHAPHHDPPLELPPGSVNSGITFPRIVTCRSVVAAHDSIIPSRNVELLSIYQIREFTSRCVSVSLLVVCGSPDPHTAWYGLIIYEQQLAIREIQAAGGRLTSEPGGPSWVRAALGPDYSKYLDRVVEVELQGKAVLDSTVSCVGRLTNVRKLSLQETLISDAGLGAVARLSQLEVLVLDGTAISDAGIAQLKSLRQLKELSLCSTHVTDDSLDTLKGFINLELLYLAHTPLTDEGIAELKQCLPRASIWHLVDRDGRRDTWPLFPPQPGLGFM
jgi:hypothetical protein